MNPEHQEQDSNKLMELRQQLDAMKAQTAEITRLRAQVASMAETKKAMTSAAQAKGKAAMPSPTTKRMTPELNLDSEEDRSKGSPDIEHIRPRDETPEWMGEFNKLANQLKAIQGTRNQDSIDLENLCLFPPVENPAGFKIPDFIKYDGTTDPKFHLKAYCTTMGSWKRDDDFFLTYFHHSLTGRAYNWYMSLEGETRKSWRHVAQAFQEQFKYNTLNELTRESVQSLRRRNDESFREFAQRWRNAAAEVRPPMTNREICRYFLKTLEDPLRSMMIFYPYEDFSLLVNNGEDLDLEIKEGRLHTSVPRIFERTKSCTEEEEGGVEYIEETSQGNFHHGGSSYKQEPTRNKKQRVRNPKSNKPLPDFGMSHSELYKTLMEQGLICPRPSRPLIPPYPGWYQPELCCEYHENAPGHSIDTCGAFENRVRMLVRANKIPDDLIPKEDATSSE